MPESELAWLLKIAHNVCLTRRRSSHRRRRVEAVQDIEAMQDYLPAPARDSTDELIRLEDALAHLPESQRRAILLREWQGLSYAEIARDLHVTQSAVETLIFRARRSLATNLQTAFATPRVVAARARNALQLGWLLPSLRSLLEGGAAAKAAATTAAVAVSSAAVLTTSAASGPPSRATAHPDAVPAAATAVAEDAEAALVERPRLAERDLVISAPVTNARAKVTRRHDAKRAESPATAARERALATKTKKTQKKEKAADSAPQRAAHVKKSKPAHVTPVRKPRPSRPTRSARPAQRPQPAAKPKNEPNPAAAAPAEAKPENPKPDAKNNAEKTK